MMRPMLTLLMVTTLVVPNIISAQEKTAKDSLASRWVTLQGELTVAEALKKLGEQTQIVVADKRLSPREAKINLNLDKVGFWRALDAIAEKAGAGVSLYQPNGKVGSKQLSGIALVEGKPPAIAPSYAGIFRGTVKELRSALDFETGIHQSKVSLTFAWEPWFKPFYLEVKSFQAGTGKSFQVSAKGQGQIPVHGRHAVEVELRFEAPPRAVKELEVLKGELSILGPEKMLDVTFAKLVSNSKPQNQDFEGVGVTLQEFTALDTGKWQLTMDLTQPPGGPEFESFQSWISNNKMFLRHKTKDGVIFEPHPIPIVGQLNSRRAVLTYLFDDGKSPTKLGKPDDWELVYHTPGRILDVSVPFEFRNLPLP